MTVTRPGTARGLLLAVPTGLLGVGLATLVGGSPASSVARLLAQLCGVLVVGLCVLERLEDVGRRAALRERVRPVLTGLLGAWLVCELALLVALAGEGGGSVLSASVAQVLGHATGVAGGRVSLFVGVAVLLALVLLRGTSLPAVLAVAGVALVARPVTGHLDGSGVLVLAAVLHVAAAAVWCGALAGLVVVAGASRGTWARLLPRFSRVALGCVAVLVGSGVVEGAFLLGSVPALVATGYGRVLLAKVAVLAGLLVLGWWARSRWVEPAAGHRVAASSSTRHAVLEVAVMAVALGLAAGLATTG